MGLLGVHPCLLGLVFLCIAKSDQSDAYGEKLHPTAAATSSRVRNNPRQAEEQVSNSVPELFTGSPLSSGRPRQPNYRNGDERSSTARTGFRGDTNKCTGRDASENGLCNSSGRQLQPAPGGPSPAKPRAVLKPKTDRAALFRRTTTTTTTTTTPQPLEEADQISESPVVRDVDLCRQSSHYSMCSKRRQRVPSSRLKPHGTSTFDPIVTTTTTTTTTTTEPPSITTRRALPITMARLHQSKSVDNASPSVQRPEQKPRILFDNFYQVGERPTAVQAYEQRDTEAYGINAPSAIGQDMTPCRDGVCSSDIIMETANERPVEVPKRMPKGRLSVQIIEEPTTPVSFLKPKYRVSPTRISELQPQPSNTHDLKPMFVDEDLKKEGDKDFSPHLESTNQDSTVPPNLSRTSTMKSNSEASNSRDGRAALLQHKHQIIRNSPPYFAHQRNNASSSTVKSRVEKHLSSKVERRHQALPASTSLQADASDIDEALLGYNYARPARPFPSPSITARSEPVDANFYNEFSRYDHPDAIQRLADRPATYPNVASVTEEVPDSRLQAEYLYPKPSVHNFALDESESIRDEIRSAAPPNHGLFGDGAHRNDFQTKQVQIPARAENSDFPGQPMRVPFMNPPANSFKSYEKIGQTNPLLSDQKASSNEQYIDHRFSQPIQNAFVAPMAQQLSAQIHQEHGYNLAAQPSQSGYIIPVTSVPFMGYQVSSASNISPSQQPPAQTFVMAPNTDQREQQANYAAHAILGALKLQAEMIQRQQGQTAEIPSARPQHGSMFGQSVEPQFALTSHIRASMLSEHDSYRNLGHHHDKPAVDSTTERPRDKAPRKKNKNKRKNNADGNAHKGRPSIDDDDIISLSTGEIVFDRPVREPEIIFERPFQRKPFKAHMHSEYAFDSSRPVHMDGPTRPLSHRTIRQKPKPLTLARAPYDIISLNRQKRQDGYIYPKPASTGTTSTGLEGEAVAPESTQKEGEGYSYPKPNAPFPPAPVPSETPTPVPGPGPTASPSAEPSTPTPTGSPPRTSPSPSSEPAVFPTAPVPIRPKPTPPANLTPGATPSEGEGYDYPKPDVPLPSPGLTPKPSPEGSVELPGPPEEPMNTDRPASDLPRPTPGPTAELPETKPSTPSISVPEQPSSGSQGEGYNYPKPAKPFS